MVLMGWIVGWIKRGREKMGWMMGRWMDNVVCLDGMDDGICCQDALVGCTSECIGRVY